MNDRFKNFDVHLLRVEEYALFKSVLNKGRHPAFVGKQTFSTNCINGGALSYVVSGNIAAVSLINPHYGTLIVLNVLPEFRGNGLGSSIVKFLMPNFVRALESRVPFFEKLGYKSIGKLKRGRSLNTQIMARKALFDLAGKLKRVWGDNE